LLSIRQSGQPGRAEDPRGTLLPTASGDETVARYCGDHMFADPRFPAVPLGTAATALLYVQIPLEIGQVAAAPRLASFEHRVAALGIEIAGCSVEIGGRACDGFHCVQLRDAGVQDAHAAPNDHQRIVAREDRIGACCAVCASRI